MYRLAAITGLARSILEGPVGELTLPAWYQFTGATCNRCASKWLYWTPASRSVSRHPITRSRKNEKVFLIRSPCDLSIRTVLQK